MDSNRSYKKNQIAPLRLSTRGRMRYNFYINDNSKNEMYDYKSNAVNQSKYNIITFLPKSLLFQFFRLANIYFLIVAIIQMIPIVSPLSPMTAVAPLVFVLLVSMFREGVEDFERHKYDNQLNNEKVIVYRDNEWVNSYSGKLLMGELVVIKKDDTFPADLVILDSSLNDGICFIETSSLDGEKTLKNKLASKFTSKKFNCNEISGNWKQSFTVSGVCNCDGPNPDLYKFDGNLDVIIENEEIKCPIDNKNLLLKGAVLRNTMWIVGFVCYTGPNTKLILNSKKAGVKYSRVERLMSNLMVAVLVIQIVLCTICSIFTSYFLNNNLANASYLPKTDYTNSVNALISYFTYMLLLNTMIPISLIITLELIKIIQGFFMSCDVEMYSHVTERYVKAGSISLNEELGHVNYIFSDKTGTLTCNKMLFKYCVIGEICYEYIRSSVLEKQDPKEIQERSEIRKKLDIIEFGPKFMEHYSNAVPFESSKTQICDNDILNYLLDESTIINEFWKALSMTHECTIDENSQKYIGLSPDDIELLKASKDQGYEYTKGKSNNKRYIKIRDEVKEFEILIINEFSSERRRMSIIINDNGTIKLYSKGADTEMVKRLSKNSNEKFISQSKKFIDYFSQFGFRTLFVAMKIIDSNKFEDWNTRYRSASMDFKHKKENIEELQNEIESGLHLIGATIVEDKLQDKVPDTIRDLKLAGIKIWMLTGDKFSTAFNIGLSCNLVSNEMKIFKIRGERGENMDFLIEEFSKFYNHNNVDIQDLPPYGIVIDSAALTSIIGDKDNLSNFLLIAHNANSVICCRVSPLQKAQVVKAMKEYKKESVIIAIGDGGNDVSMLMEAHIGIGVYGEEGMRAVQASDFAIGEFKILRRLLLYHGRTNYIRITEMILYFFFKNFIFSINHFYYAFLNNASGQTIIDDWFISLFNLFFTSCPLAARALLDHDVKPEDGLIVNLLMPYLYMENRQNPIFSIKNFFLNIFRGLFEGFIIFIILYQQLSVSIADINGNYADLWFLSVDMFTIIIIVVSVRILIVQKFYTIFNVLIMLFTTFLLYALFVIFVDSSDNFHSFGTMKVAFCSPAIWINIILVSSMCFIIDYSFYAWHVIFSDQLTQKLRVLINEKGSINCEDDLTSDLKSIFQLFKNVTNNQVIHYSLEDDYKKNDKNIHNNTNELEVSINETKKNINAIIANKSKSLSDNNRFFSDNEDVVIKTRDIPKTKIRQADTYKNAAVSDNYRKLVLI